MIFHIISAKTFHHGPNIINNTLQFAEKMGTKRSEHLFVLFDYTTDLEKYYIKPLDKISSNNVIKLTGRSLSLKLFQVLLKLKPNDCAFIHGINVHSLWFILFLSPSKFYKKICWVCWGAGTERGATLKRRLTINRIKTYVLPKLGCIITLLSKDAEKLALNFNCKNVQVIPYLSQSVDFNSPIYTPLIQSDERDLPLNILLGNSAWTTNNHIDALLKLRRFAGDHLVIYCPLSYGPKEDTYKMEVVKVGKEIFNDKFKPIFDLMPSQEYVEFLKKMDVIYINADRQMALFAVYVGIYYGKKIVLKRHSHNFDWLKEAAIFDLDDFNSFADFKAPLTENMKVFNREILRKKTAVEDSGSKWKAVFTKLSNAN